MIPVIVATLAPIVNCIQLFPQLYKTYITKSVEDLSLYITHTNYKSSLVITWIFYKRLFTYCSGYYKYDGKYNFIGIVFSL